MYASDFEYDGKALSDYGYMICNFSSSGMETVSNGSEITFNTVSTLNGTKYQLTSAVYEDCLEVTFQICKKQCVTDENGNTVNTAEDILEISREDLREMMRWLNRRGFYKFRFLDEGFDYYYFEGSFNISRIEVDERLVGLELTLITNRPFAIMEPVTMTLTADSASTTVSFTDVSDEEGYIYPETKITVKSAGNLSIYSELEDRTTYIANCSNGEVITMNYPIISTSVSSHKIQGDFNWRFFRIANTFQNNLNEFTISLPCTIEMTYSPVVKVGL